VLPNSSFKPAMSNQAAMGLPPAQILGLGTSLGEGIKNYVWLDITASLRHVKDLAADPNLFLRRRHGTRYVSLSGGTTNIWQFASLPALGNNTHSIVDVAPLLEDEEDEEEEDDDDDDDDDEEEEEEEEEDGDDDEDHSPALSDTQSPESRQRSMIGDITTDTFKPEQEPQLGFELGLTIVPRMAQVCQPSTTRKLRDFVQLSSVREQARSTPCHNQLPSHVSRNFSIMKATISSVELMSLDSKSASVLCYDVLPHHNHHNRQPTPWDLSRNISERISMYHHIPDLGLVILGSLAGRVAVLSLTRPPERHSFGPSGSDAAKASSSRGPPAREGARIRRAFRVEAVLPRKAEEDKNLRPWCTLHGIAVSPAPDHRTEGLRSTVPGGGWRPRAWRLILHYVDHTILMYDIAKHEEHGEVLIF